MTETTANLDPISRLTRDLRDAAITLSEKEARFLVDAYYQMQENRKRSGNQVRALTASEEPHMVLSWLFAQDEVLEGQIQRALDRWSASKPLGQWARSITGIGPVIAAGLLAHIEAGKHETVGHTWRFAGLDPTVKWEPKTKRPWNASLKTLCWKIGESFVKVSTNTDDYYGKIYVARKGLEWENNLTGKLSEQATAATKVKKFGDDTQAVKWYKGAYSPATVREFLEQGKNFLDLKAAPEGEGIPMLPPAHIHARAKRYAVKLFLSHFHHVGYVLVHNRVPPKPFVIQHLGHVDMIEPPNMEVIDSFRSKP